MESSENLLLQFVPICEIRVCLALFHSVQTQRHGVPPSRDNRHHTTQACGHFGLAFVVVSPRDDGAVLFQRHGVTLSHGNRHHPTQACGHCGLALDVYSPRDDLVKVFTGLGDK